MNNYLLSWHSVRKCEKNIAKVIGNQLTEKKKCVKETPGMGSLEQEEGHKVMSNTEKNCGDRADGSKHFWKVAEQTAWNKVRMESLMSGLCSPEIL